MSETTERDETTHAISQIIARATDDVGGGDGMTREWVTAIRLMRAAPDLLEACKAIVRWWDICCVKSTWPETTPVEMDRVRAAIAKATGKEG